MTLKVVKSFSRAASTYFSCHRRKLYSSIGICRVVLVQRLCSSNRMAFMSPTSCSALTRRTFSVASLSQRDNEQDEEEDYEEEEDSEDEKAVSDAFNIQRDRNLLRVVRHRLRDVGNETVQRRRLTDEQCALLRRDVLCVLQTNKLPVMSADGKAPPESTGTEAAIASGDPVASTVCVPATYSLVLDRIIDSHLLKVLRRVKAYGAAFSCLDFLRRHDLFNAATAVLACELIYKASINKIATEQEVADLIAFIEQSFPVTFSVSSVHKFYCVAATSKYKNAAQELKAEGLNYVSPSRHLILIGACFEHNDSWAAFDLLNGLSQNRNIFVGGNSVEFKDMCCSACIFLARRAKSHPENALALFHKFLNMTRNLKVPGLPCQVEPLIRDLFTSIGPEWVTNLTQIATTGKCSCCSMLMPKEELSSKEFEDMKKVVMQELLQGKDIFRSSSPDEMQRFMTHVATSAPYDIVFDALNVALNGTARLFTASTRAQKLIGVIEDFKWHLGCKAICVVTRRHLLRTTPQQLAYLRKSTSLVLLDDSTVDDPFVLYSALASGPGCYVVSKDRYDFLDRVLDVRMQALFKRWLRTRLINDWKVGVDGKLNLPQLHALSSHIDEQGCHIPLIPKSSQHVNTPVQWLCVRRDNKQPR